MSLSAWTYGRTPTNWMDSSLGTLVYREEVDSGKVQFAPSGSTAERTFYVDYNDVDLFVDHLLGYGYWDSTTKITRKELPDEHPYFARMYAVAASVEPFPQGRAAVMASPINFTGKPFAKVVAQYEAPDYKVATDAEIVYEWQRFCSFKYTFQTQQLTLTGSMQFEATQRKLSVQPAIRSQVMVLQVTWHNVPALDDNPFQVPTQSAILDLEGKLNSSSFMTFDAGTVLFAGLDPVMSKPRCTSTTGEEGLWTWNIVYTFHLKDNGTSDLYGEKQGWQYTFDLQQGRYDRLRSVIGNQLAYQTGDLNALFTID